MCFLKMLLVYDGSSRWNSRIDQTVCVNDEMQEHILKIYVRV